MKNELTALDIRVYDYVQAYSETVKKLSMPMYVDSIFGEETVYLTFKDNEADPWEEDTKDLRALKITKENLVNLGFTKKCKQEYTLLYDEYAIDVVIDDWKPLQVVVLSGLTFWKRTWNCQFVHDMQHFFYDQTKKPLKLDWNTIIAAHTAQEKPKTANRHEERN